jgi:hypothetical protein
VAGTTAPACAAAHHSDNRFLLDGLSTTDPATGTFGFGISRDAIEEVAVHTGGYEAEYGMGIGGVVNLVTRSGGNTFSGSLDVRYRDQRFIENGEHFDRDQQTSSSRAIAGALGGPLVRDRLWFFAAVENRFLQSQDEGAPPARRRVEWSGAELAGWAPPLVPSGRRPGRARANRAVSSPPRLVERAGHPSGSSSQLSSLDPRCSRPRPGRFGGAEYTRRRLAGTRSPTSTDTESCRRRRIGSCRTKTPRGRAAPGGDLRRGSGDTTKLGADYQRLSTSMS